MHFPPPRVTLHVSKPESNSVVPVYLVSRLEGTQDGSFQCNLGFSGGKKKVCCLYSTVINLNTLKVIVLLITANRNLIKSLIKNKKQLIFSGEVLVSILYTSALCVLES